MKCSKRRTLIFIVISIIFIASIAAIVTLSPLGEKNEENIAKLKRCKSGDCFTSPDIIKKPIREVCDTKECLTTQWAHKHRQAQITNNLYSGAVTKPGLYGGETCTTRECVLQAAKILRWMDTSVKPCEDFYNFSCGKFPKTYALPDGWTSFGVEDLAEEEVSLRIKNILELPRRINESDALKKVKQLYKSCLNTTHVEQNSLRHLKDLLSGKGVGDWPFLKTDWNDCRLDLEWRMAKLNALGIDSFFRLLTDFKGDDQQAFVYMTVAPPLVEGICDDDEENETIALDNALKKASGHIKMVKKVLTLLQVKDNDTEQDINDMFVFDYMFCNATNLSRSEMEISRNPSEWNSTLQDLINVSPEINWGRWRNIIFGELGLNFPHDKFNIYTYGMNISLDGIIELLHNTSSRVLANYLTWKFVHHHLGFMGGPFRQIVESRRGYFKGALHMFMDSERRTPRWHQCVRYVKDLMPLSVLPSYLRRILTIDMQSEMDNVVLAVKNSFRDIFRKNSILLRDEKVTSIHKIDKVGVELYYPDRKMTFYDKYYFEMGTLGDCFIKNGLKVKHYQLRKLLEGIYAMKTRYDLDYSILLWNPFVVDAWSAFPGNQIVIFLGEIQSAQISSKLPRFLGMSTLGTTVGQELARGFDLARIKGLGPEQYNWTTWPDYVIRHAESRAHCSIDKYFNKNYVDTSYEEGQSSIDEYLTKNQGVYLAYKAFMNYVGEERRLPGLSYTNKELFFIRYAQTQCKIVAQGTVTDPGVTTNRVLMNIESFSETFKCPRGTSMNPSQKCGQLWS